MTYMGRFRTYKIPFIFAWPFRYIIQYSTAEGGWYFYCGPFALSKNASAVCNALNKAYAMGAEDMAESITHYRYQPTKGH